MSAYRNNIYFSIVFITYKSVLEVNKTIKIKQFFGENPYLRLFFFILEI